MEALLIEWAKNAPVLFILAIAWIQERSERRQLQQMFLAHLEQCTQERCTTMRSMAQELNLRVKTPSAS